VQHAARAALLLPLVLLGCSSLALPKEDAPASGPDPASNSWVADNLKEAFKDHASYDGFEISEYRSVHSIKGWAWLVCVRFQDHAQKRTYALFIKGDHVVDGRYAVQTDGCDAQSYSPFDLMSGRTGPANAGGLAPLY